MTKADIVIVNWNSRDQLRQCIQSVRANNAGMLGKCIVVDNGSVDGSADFLDGASDVELVRAGSNLGFAAACNLGVARGISPYILLLNPDACLFADALPKSLAFLDAPQNLDVGIVGVQLVGSDGTVHRSCARLPTAWRLLAKSFGISAIFKNADIQMIEWDHSETKIVGQVMGAYFLTRRELFDNLSGFDERFFVYFEEVDFSTRAMELGYRSAFLADASVFHKSGGVSDQVKDLRLFYSLRSRVLYSCKHFSVPSAGMVALAALIIEPLTRMAFLLIRGRSSEIADLISGYKLFWSWALRRPARRFFRGFSNG